MDDYHIFVIGVGPVVEKFDADAGVVFFGSTQQRSPIILTRSFELIRLS